MNRRDFLSGSASALTLFAAPTLRADILKGKSAKMHGQRDRAVWLAANRLVGVSLAWPPAGARIKPWNWPPAKRRGSNCWPAPRWPRP